MFKNEVWINFLVRKYKQDKTNDVKNFIIKKIIIWVESKKTIRFHIKGNAIKEEIRREDVNKPNFKFKI